VNVGDNSYAGRGTTPSTYGKVAKVFVRTQKMGNLGSDSDLIRYLTGMLEQAGNQGHRTGYSWGINSGKALAHAAFWVTSLYVFRPVTNGFKTC